MKLKNVKKAVAIVLAGTIIFAMTGCGKKEKKDKEKDVCEYDAVIEAEFDGSIERTVVLDNVLYASYYNFDTEETSDIEIEEQGLIVYDFETKEKNQLKIDMKDVYISDFYLDGNKNIIVNAMKLVENSNTDTTVTDEENGTYEEESAYQYAQVKLIYNDKLECISTEESELKMSSGDGSDITDEIIMDVEVDGEGRVYSMCTNIEAESQEYFIKVTDKDENEIANISISDMADSMMRMADGSIACSIWGENGTELYKVDVEAKELGEKVVELTNSFALGIYAGLDNSLLINENGYLKRMDVNTGKTKNILKFMDSEIISDNVVVVIELENDEFFVVTQDYDNNKSEIDRLVKKDENSKTVKKQEIHLGTLSLDSTLQQQVIMFNKSNDKYKIIIDDYSADIEDEDDYTEAIKKFHAALTSSNCPDIIDLNYTSLDEYAGKGVLESLDSYLEKDSELSEDVFVQSVLDVYKVNDKIYTIPMDFAITGFSGYKSIVGSETAWTMQEFVDFAENLPQGTQLMQDLTSDGVMMGMLYYNMDEYINWTTGECNFDTEEFVELLEYCSNFESSEEYYEDYEYDDDEYDEVGLIRDKKIAIRDFYCDSVYTYLEEKAIYGDEMTIKGYPGKEGTGIVVETFSTLLGISSSSKYKDVAWEFLREFYTEDYQDEMNIYGFSIRQDKLDEAFEEIKNSEVEVAEDGTKYISETYYNEVPIYIPPMTDEDVKNIQNLIDSADTLANADEEVFSLITEEAEAFFKGQKSAKEVAEVIQSRVSIYVKENS